MADYVSIARNADSLYVLLESDINHFNIAVQNKLKCYFQKGIRPQNTKEATDLFLNVE